MVENQDQSLLEKSRNYTTEIGSYVIERSFTCYYNKAKNMIKIEKPGLFSIFISATIFCRYILLLFGS